MIHMKGLSQQLYMSAVVLLPPPYNISRCVSNAKVELEFFWAQADARLFMVEFARSATRRR